MMMKLDQITPLTWKRLFISLFIIVVASVIRALFFGGLGRGIPYLTYYPAIMIAAIYGGLFSGLLATVFSALLTLSTGYKKALSPH
jgi:hypothetical protein